MNFPKFQRLVEERSRFSHDGESTASGEYFSESCGDMYNFFLKVGPGAVIEDISYFHDRMRFRNGDLQPGRRTGKGEDDRGSGDAFTGRDRSAARRLSREEERLSGARAGSASRRARRLSRQGCRRKSYRFRGYAARGGATTGKHFRAARAAAASNGDGKVLINLR